MSNHVTPGQHVLVTHLEPTTGFIVADRHLACRKSRIYGTVRAYVPGHGGDVWFVEHEDSQEVGAYSIDELMPDPHSPVADAANAARKEKHDDRS